MRKTLAIFVLILMAFNGYSQLWEYHNEENRCEGISFKLAYVQGKGEFPYNTPILGIRKSSDLGIEILMAGCAYVDQNNTIVKYYFDNQEAKEVFISTSDDGQNYFFKFQNQDEFIKKLKELQK